MWMLTSSRRNVNNIFAIRPTWSSKSKLHHHSIDKSFLSVWRFRTKKFAAQNHVLKNFVRCCWSEKCKNDDRGFVSLLVQSPPPPHLLYLLNRIFVLLSHRGCQGELICIVKRENTFMANCFLFNRFRAGAQGKKFCQISDTSSSRDDMKIEN